MNKIIYPFIFLLLLSCGDKQLTFDDVDKFDFEVLPKNCTETSYKVDFKYGEYETGEKLNFSTYSFYDDGYSIGYNYDKWTYSQSKNKEEISDLHISDNDSTISKAIYYKGQLRRIFIDSQNGDSTIMEIKDSILTSYYPEKYRSVATLDEFGKEIVNIYYDNEGQLIRTTLRTYNDKGLLETITSKDSKYESLNNVLRFEYIEFDKKGNWIKKLEFRDNSVTPETITIREIKY